MSDDKTISTIGKLLSDRAEKPYVPSPAQKQAKAQMWKRAGDTLPERPELATASRFVDDTANLAKWWDTPGFQAWLWNRNEFDERLDYLASIVLDQFETILTSARSSDSAKMAAAKMVLEASRKLGRTSDGAEFADEKIAKMDRGQLEEFIAKSMKLVAPTTK